MADESEPPLGPKGPGPHAVDPNAMKPHGPAEGERLALEGRTAIKISGGASVTAHAGELGTGSTQVSLEGAEARALAGDASVGRASGNSAVADAGASVATATGSTVVFENSDGASFIGRVSPASPESVVRRIERDPDLYSRLAKDAASQIGSALAELDAQKPNEASALIGYANISRVLTSLKANLETIAADIDGAIATTSPEARATRLRRAADVALKLWDQVIDWVDNNTNNVALVIAQMGLAGTIAEL